MTEKRKQPTATCMAAAALIVLMALSSAGCGGGDKTAAKASNEVLKAGAAGSGDSLEPAENYFSRQVTRYGIGECLTGFDEHMAVRPWLVESWKISDDKLSWTFKIRDNVKFSNGNKLTADAVKKSLERTFAKAKRASVIFEPESFTANGQELTVRTKRPYAALPGLLGDPLFLIADVTEDGRRNFGKEGPVCTGPYMVTGFSREKCELAANPHYRDGKAPYKKLVVNAVDDPHTRALALQKGKIDIVESVGSGDMALFKDKNRYNVYEISSVSSVLARLNQNEGRPLADKRVRRALIRALDRETWCKVLLKDTFIPGAPMLPPSVNYGFDELMKQNPDRYDFESARKLLAEAGWKDTNKDGYVDKDGKNLELDCYYSSSHAELPLFAEATRSDARKLGIRVNLKSVDSDAIYKIGVSGGYDLLISNVMTIPTGDPECFMSSYFRTNKNGDTPENASGYSNPEYDMLSSRLSGEFDTAKRRDIVIKMEKIMMDDAGIIIYGYPRTNMISLKEIEGVRIFPSDYYWLTKDIKPAGN